MPVIYSPRLAELYRNAANRTSSILTATPPANYILTSDGNGASTWTTGGSTSNIPDLTVTNLTILDTLNSSSTFVNYLSAGNIEINTASFPQLNTNTLSTATLVTTTLLASQISTTTLSTASLYTAVANVSSLQVNALSTGSITLDSGVFSAGNTNSVSTFETTATTALASSIVANTVSTGVLAANTVRFVSLTTPSTLTATLDAQQVSTTRADAATVSTNALLVSSVNGVSYPPIFAIPQNISFSTVTVRDYTNTPSTFTNSISTATLSTDLATFSTLNVSAVNATTVTATNLTTRALSTTTVSTATLYSGLATVSTLNAQQITAQSTLASQLYTSTLNTDVISTGTGILASVNTSALSTQTATLSSLAAATGNVSALSTNQLETSQIQIAQGSMSTLAGNLVSTGIFGVGEATIPSASAFTTSALSLSTNSVSTTEIQTEILSTLDLRFSTLNGDIYPQLYAISPNLLQSTITLATSTLSASTFTSVLSTTILETSLARATAISTGILSTGSLTIPELSVSAFTAPTTTLSSFTVNTLVVSTLNTDSFFAQDINAAGYANTTAVISTVNAQSYGYADNLYAQLVTALQANQTFLSANSVFAAAAAVSSEFSSEISTGALTATAVLTETAALSTLSTTTFTVGQFTANAVATNEVSSQTLQITAADSFQLRANTVSANTVAVDQFSVRQGIASTISTGYLQVSTAQIGALNANLISVASIRIPNLITPALSTTALSTSTAYFSTAYMSSAQAFTVSTGTLVNPVASFVTLTTNQLSTTIASIPVITADTISTGTLSTAVLSTAVIIGGTVSTQNLSTNRYITPSAVIQTLNTNVLSTGGITVTAAQFNAFNATNLSTGSYIVTQTATLSTTNVIDTLSTSQLFTDYLSAGTLQAYGISTYSLAVWGPNTLTVQGSTIITGPVYANTVFTAETVNTQTVEIQSMLYTNSLTTTSTLTIDVATGPHLTVSQGLFETAQVSSISTGSFVAEYTNVSSVVTNFLSTSFVYAENVIASSLTVNCIVSISTVNNVADVAAKNIIANSALINSISTNYVSSGAISSGTAYTSSLTGNFISSGNAYVGSVTANDVTTLTLSSGIIGTTDFRTGGLSTFAMSVADLATGTQHITRGLSTGQISTTAITASNVTFVSLSTNVMSTGSVYVASSIFTSLSTTTLTADSMSFRGGNATLAFLSTNQVSTGSAFIQYAEVGTTSVDSFASQTIPATSLVVGGISTTMVSTNLLLINGAATVSSMSTLYVSTGGINPVNPASFIPTSYTGLQLWLDAADTTSMVFSGQSVIKWTDKSINQFPFISTKTTTTLTQQNPGYIPELKAIYFKQPNTDSVLRADSQGLAIQNPLNLSTIYPTVFCVVTPDSGNTSFQAALRVGTTNSTTLRLDHFYQFSPNSGTALNVITATGVGTITLRGLGFNNNFYNPNVLSVYTLATYQAGGTYSKEGNLLQTSNSNYLSSPRFIVQNAVSVGAGYDSRTYKGKIHEILFYDRPLTTTEIQTVEGYLTWKWNVEQALPLTNPYNQQNYLGNVAQVNTVQTESIDINRFLTRAPNVLAQAVNVSTFSTAQLTATAARFGSISTTSISTGQAFATSLIGSTLTMATLSTNRISTNLAFMANANISTINLSTIASRVDMNTATANISSLTVGWVVSTGSYAGPGLTMGRSLGDTFSTGIAMATEIRTSSMNVDFVSTGRQVAFSTFANYVSAITATVPIVSTRAIYISSINGTIYSGDGSQPALSLTSLTATTFSTNTLAVNAVSTNRLETTGAANFQYVSSQIMYLVTDYSNGRIRYSYDSINWTLGVQLGSIELYAVAWNGQYWLAGAEGSWNSTIRKSIDGINWTTTTGGFANDDSRGRCFGFAWNNSNRWVAVGDQASLDASVQCIKYSTNGDSWNNSEGDSFRRGYGVAYGNNMWIAVGNYNTGESRTSTIMSSTDGVRWAYINSGGFSVGSGFGGRGVVWGGNKWVAVGTGDANCSSIQYSYDGRNWSNAGNFFTTTGGEYGTGYGVAWNGKLFIATGTDEFNALNTIQHSYNGISWRSSITGAFPSSLGGNSLNRPGGRSVCWDGKKWIAVGYGNGSGGIGFSTIQHSYDGSNWFVPSKLEFYVPSGIAYAQPAVPDINLGNLQIFGQGKPPSSINTHNIYATYTSLVFDDFLYVDKYRSSVAINSELPVNRGGSTIALYVSGIIQTYNTRAIKQGDAWDNSSDQRIKENIQFADLTTCCSTVKQLELYHYRYTPDFLSRVTIHDKSVLGFIAQDMAAVFPKSVKPMNVYGYENLLVMNQTQAEMAHYGATRHLMDKTDEISRQIENLTIPPLEPLHPILSTFQTLESNLATQSTLYGFTTNAYLSTIHSQTEQVYSLRAKFDDLISNISSLLAAK
jgi:hypothetical protein